jgi:hypothetical protein
MFAYNFLNIMRVLGTSLILALLVCGLWVLVILSVMVNLCLESGTKLLHRLK